jgi:hypothetical protein
VCRDPAFPEALERPLSDNHDLLSSIFVSRIFLKRPCEAVPVGQATMALDHGSQTCLSIMPPNHASQTCLSIMPLNHTSQPYLSTSPSKHASRTCLSNMPPQSAPSPCNTSVYEQDQRPPPIRQQSTKNTPISHEETNPKASTDSDSADHEQQSETRHPRYASCRPTQIRWCSLELLPQ